MDSIATSDHGFLSRGAKEASMSISYFRRMAAESFRRARASAQPHIDYESLLTLGRTFKARATAARARLAAMRATATGKQAAERAEYYRDRRE
jgi:hypothetical protein